MSTEHNEKANFFDQNELENFKQKTNQLKINLENNNFDNALKCINEINELNSKSFYELIGKLTRGLHIAISDLDLSDDNKKDAENNRARLDLKYVIQMTHDAAHKTLDMTEKAMGNISDFKETQDHQEKLLLEFEQSPKSEGELTDMLSELRSNSEKSRQSADELSSIISEIIVAQNYQDLASQSISKVINIIKQVESSLISLTQCTNLLKKLSRFGPHDKFDLDDFDSDEIRSDIEKINSINKQEHLDQNDVDNLLSNLGF